MSATRRPKIPGTYVIPLRHDPRAVGVCVAVCGANGVKRIFVPPSFSSVRDAVRHGNKLAESLRS